MWWRAFDEGRVIRALNICHQFTPDLSLLQHAKDDGSGDDDTKQSNEDLSSTVSAGDATFVTTLHRDNAVQDMLALCKIFQLSLQVFCQSVNIFDCFLSVIKVRPKFLNCICLSCVFLAMQYSGGPSETPGGTSVSPDINRFINVSQSKCTYSDVVRMSEVISKKLGLDLTHYTTLHPVLSLLNESFHFPSFTVILDFYATCLCKYNLAIQPPKTVLAAILRVFVPPEHLGVICNKIGLTLEEECCQQVYQLFSKYNSGRREKGSIKKYSFRLSQRTGQTLLSSRSRSPLNKLSSIAEEGNTSQVPNDIVSTGNGDSSKSRNRRKAMRYSKLPCWFGFSNQATARATKPYYHHLVSSWCPWSQVPDQPEKLFSVFLIN
jgi:hypothetical protein